jgi:hypothetical protein
MDSKELRIDRCQKMLRNSCQSPDTGSTFLGLRHVEIQNKPQNHKLFKVGKVWVEPTTISQNNPQISKVSTNQQGLVIFSLNPSNSLKFDVLTMLAPAPTTHQS